jgi:hypothetical protein
MKKWIIPVICMVCAVYLLMNFFTSHKGVTYVSIGTTYNKFLFFSEKSAHFTITFKSLYTGNLTLIDDKGNTLPSSKYTISVDGKNSGPSFSVKNKRLVNVAIRCTKAVSPGKQYVQVRGGGPLVTHVYFRHHLNPLIVWISWIVTLLAVISLLWFLILRRMFYPQFRSCMKTFVIPNQAPLIVKMTGARMVVISSEYKKQGFWDALIKGPVIYKSHPAFTSSITMRPMKGRRIIVKVDNSIYRVSPNPMPSIGTAAIDNILTNTHITIN